MFKCLSFTNSTKLFIFTFLAINSFLLVGSFTYTDSLNGSAQLTIFESVNMEPDLQFNVLTDNQEARHLRDVTIRNVTDTTQIFHLKGPNQEDELRTSFLHWQLPEVVAVPAHHSVIFSVILTSDINHPTLIKMAAEGQTFKSNLTLVDMNNRENNLELPISIHFSDN